MMYKDLLHRQRREILVLVLILTVLFAGWRGLIILERPYRQARAGIDAEKKEIEENFPGDHGANEKLNRVLTSTMVDPSEFVHIRTLFWPSPEIIAQVQYWYGDGMGGESLNYALFRVSRMGKIIELMEINEGIILENDKKRWKGGKTEGPQLYN